MIEPRDSDYTVVINVCTAVRNKNTDAAAEEIAHYRDHCARVERKVLAKSLDELQRKMHLHAANGGDCPYEAKAVGAYALELKAVIAELRGKS